MLCFSAGRVERDSGNGACCGVEHLLTVIAVGGRVGFASRWTTPVSYSIPVPVSTTAVLEVVLDLFGVCCIVSRV